MQMAPGSQSYVLPHDAIGPDKGSFPDLGPGMHDRRGVNLKLRHAKAPESTSMKVTSASLTASESTEQIPFALPIFPRAFVSSTSIFSVSPGRTGLRHLTLSAA